MSKSETLRRYLLFVVSLFFSALGVAFIKHGALGVSPTSSVANILSLKFTKLTLGAWVTAWNLLLILGQVVILRSNFSAIQLLQLPLSFLFGWFTDLGMVIVDKFPVHGYAGCMAFLIIGIIIRGFGVSLSVIANIILNSNEAFIKAISNTYNKSFGNTKIVFDITNVILAAGLSLVFFGNIVEIREGTIIAALLTGFAVNIFNKLLTDPLNTVMTCRHIRATKSRKAANTAEAA